MLFVWRESKSSRPKVFFLARLPLSSSSGERAGFFGGPFCPYSWVFPGYWILQLQVWNTWGKKKIQDSQLWVVSQIPRSLIALPYSFHLSQLSYVILYVIELYLFLVGRIRKNTFTPSSWQWKSEFHFEHVNLNDRSKWTCQVDSWTYEPRVLVVCGPSLLRASFFSEKSGSYISLWKWGQQKRF